MCRLPHYYLLAIRDIDTLWQLIVGIYSATIEGVDGAYPQPLPKGKGVIEYNDGSWLWRSDLNQFASESDFAESDGLG